MIRIVLTGAECTGKTTLTKALARHYAEPWTGEFVRDYVSRLDRPLQPSDLEPIAMGQLALEDSANDQAKRLVLHDTNLLSSILYANHYFDAQIKRADEAFLQRDYALYLLCTPGGIEWEPDPGQREGPEARDALHRIFEHELKQRKLPYVELKGSGEERFDGAISAIDALIAPR